MKQEILKHLSAHHPWRDRILVLDVLDSTNAYARHLAKEGAPEGTVVIARQQTAGRGRMNRSFHSPPDAGLYLSLVLRPKCMVGDLIHLTCAVAVAVCDAIENVTGVRPGVKWINDLVLNKRKIGGILTQLRISCPGTVDYATIGIGINLTAQEFPRELGHIATSLEAELGTAPSLPKLAAAVIVALEAMDLEGQWLDQYRKDCITLGSQVRVISDEDTREGRALDVCPNGALLVEFTDGHRETVAWDDVSVRGLWDYI